MSGNELKQKANEFYAKEIWQSNVKKRVYLDWRDLFTTEIRGIFIGEYDNHTDGREFFLDVIQRLREYTKDYAIPTSMQNMTIDYEDE